MGLFELVVIVVALSTVSTIFKSAFAYRARRLPATDQEALQRIEDGLQDLRDQVGALHAETAELQERVDFTERMLAQHRDASQRLGA